MHTATLPSAFDLTGRVAIVTGAGSGIGLGISQALAAAGALVGVRRRERRHG